MSEKENNNYYEVGEDTEILCVDCFKGHLISYENNEAECDACGTHFLITGINQFKYL